MEYMFAQGFLGTKAPFFMDFVTLVVALLPLLLHSSVLLVRKGFVKLHALSQVAIYIVSVIVVLYFEYGVRVAGGFDYFMQSSDASYGYSLVVLGLHVIVATLTFGYWSYTVFRAANAMQSKQLPGRFSNTHRVMAFKSFIGIVFTSFSGIWVYILLFIY